MGGCHWLAFKLLTRVEEKAARTAKCLKRGAKMRSVAVLVLAVVCRSVCASCGTVPVTTRQFYHPKPMAIRPSCHEQGAASH